MASEHTEDVTEFVAAGLAALAAGLAAQADGANLAAVDVHRSAADVNFRHAVHICGTAADVVDEIIRQTGGTVP